jgi:hypothetical protein
MALRPTIKTEHALRMSFIAGVALRDGDEVSFGADDDTVALSAVNDDLAIGVTVSPALVGKRVEVVLYGTAIVEMTVGTGGATRGKWQWKVADGVTDAPPNGGGTTPVSLVGRAMQSGNPADRIGVMVGAAGRRAVTA